MNPEAARLLADLLEFVRIPSVSADRAYADSVTEAAEFLVGLLRTAGVSDVRLLETQGNPVVFAHHETDPQLPTVLVYGHYDVQPPDPVQEWQTAPFEPTVSDGIITARGVSDDKAPVMIAIAAVRSLLTQGELNCNVKFILEGEEEIGSPSLEPFLRAHADLLAADFVLSADGGMWLPDLPTVVIQARGIVGLEFTVQGPQTDLHSGRHGGGIANPLHAIASIIHGLHDEHGRVTVPGFYSGVTDLTAGQRQKLTELPFSDSEYLNSVGARATFGEAGYTTLERQWYRPTLEVNGMWGGYQGEGSKTVLPASAHAKITCRLVPGQDPAAVRDSLVSHIQALTPPGVLLELDPGSHMAEAYMVPLDHPALLLATDVLRDTFETEPLLVGMGGTLPVSSLFQRILGISTIFFSFAVGDENIHAPNEFFRVKRLKLGLTAWKDFLGRTAAAWTN